MLGEAQIVTLPFAGGVNEREREETLGPAGEMRVLSCYQMTKTNGYQKAPGNTALSMTILGGGTISSAKRVCAFRGETLLATSTNLYSRDTASATWRNAGLVPACSATRVGIAKFTAAILSANCAVVNGYIVVAWTTATTVYVAVVDSTTYARVLFSQVTVATARVCVGAVGSQAFVFYTTAANSAINTIQVNTSAMTIGAPVATILDGDFGATQSMDVATLSDRIVIAYNNQDGTTDSVTVRSYNAPANVLTQIASGVVASVNPPFGPVGIGGSVADELFVANVTAANVTRVTALLATTLAVNGTAATVIAQSADKVGVVRTSATTGFVWVTRASTTTMYSSTFSLAAGAIVAGPAPFGAANVHAYSKPFLVGSRYYGAIYPYMTGLAPLNQTRLLVDLTEFQTSTAGARLYPMATLAPQTTSFFDVSTIQNAAQISATKYVMVGGSLRTANSGAIELDIFDFADPNLCQTAPYGDVLGISGGTPYTYDGANTAEMGFVASPGVLTSVNGAGALPAGDYSWCVVYEHVDAAGQFHRSAPSPVLTVTMGGANGRTVTVHRLPLSARDTPIMARLYRTALGGSIFYAVPVATVDVSPNGATTTTVTFAVDATTDGVLQAGAPLYTHPGLLGAAVPRTAPSSLSCLISHADRLIGVGDDGRTVWVSGQQITGDGLWWSSFAGFQYPQQRGPILAAASMDGRLVTWTRDDVFLLDGQGPPDNGQGGGYVTSQIVSDVGCISQRSVCVTSGGVMFQSLRGLERMNRSLQIEPLFGSRVEDTLAAYPVITSAVLQQATGRVVFSCLVTEGGATGTALEYDLTNGIWTVCPRVAGAGMQSAAMVGGTTPSYVWVTAAGVAYQELTASALDAGVYKSGRLLTPWIHMQGLTGTQRVDTLQILAKALSGHDLRVRVAYDYSATFTDSVTWTAAQIAALTTSREVLQVDLSRPEGTAMQVEIVDTTPSSGLLGTGYGPALIGLQLVARGDDALSKLPEANRQ